MTYSSRFRVFENHISASSQVASELFQLIRDRALLGRNVVLGLPAGTTAEPLYEELVYLHREEGLSFQNVVTFNLDEYLGLADGHPAGFRPWMNQALFDHVDILPKNIHFLSGKIQPSSAVAHCTAYERKIEEAGGIDYQILGIGRNGHIGFNEPGTSVRSRTRVVALSEMTRQDATSCFGESERIPTHALTMGCATILDARRIVLLAWSSKKSRIVRRALEGPASPRLPASYLQRHPGVQFFLDGSAASLLPR